MGKKKKRKRADEGGGEMRQEAGPVVNTAVRKTQRGRERQLSKKAWRRRE